MLPRKKLIKNPLDKGIAPLATIAMCKPHIVEPGKGRIQSMEADSLKAADQTAALLSNKVPKFIYLQKEQ